MKRTHMAAVAITTVALAAAVWLFMHRGPSTPMNAAQDKGQVLYWYDPMKPDVHFDKPGKSPFMDMQLLPKYASEEAGGTQVISIDPRMMQNLGIRTAPVERGRITQELRATGIVTANENAIQVVQARAAGWVERLHVRVAGEPVRKGELLAEIYSPELLAAEQELIVAAQMTGRGSLAEAARSRLLSLGLTDPQVAAIEKRGRAERRVDLYSPLDGVITELGMREGSQVSPGKNLFTVTDLSKVWVTAQISEAQGGWIAHGQAVETRLLALPGRTFNGVVDYVYPDLTADTRTLKARIVLNNPRLELKPGMYADVTLRGGAGQVALFVPSESLIRTGTRSTIILADGGGQFHPVEVLAGEEADGRVAILNGLHEGDQVVTSGQFLIDSEANLRGAFSRMTASQEAVGHGEMHP